MNKNDYKHILIIGMAGGLANITAKLLLMNYPKVRITGVDQRPPPAHFTPHENIEYKRIRYTRGSFERLFRDHHFDVVYHLGRLTHGKDSLMTSFEDRLDLNLIETKRILDLSLKFEVKKVVILSTYHVYGALHDNPTFLLEDNPLRAAIKYPELRDVVEMDQIATNWLWKNQRKIETVVLRPATIIGPQINNTMTRYLLTPYAPVCADFNPMYQFIHEFDMANILMKTLYHVPSGIYNIAPDECISLKEAKRILQIPTTPIQSFLLKFSNRLAQAMAWSLPRYFIDYLKYSCIIDNSLIKAQLGEDLFRYKTKEALIISKLD
jgi:UDP-glucose 4-epimerase